MKFELSKIELQRLEEFRKALQIVFNEEQLTGNFTYLFSPTSIGDGVDIIYTDKKGRKYIKDITDFDSW